MARIGAQMFTLREFCKAPDDIARSCEKVKAMGYDGIQASAAGFNTLDTDELKAIRKALDDNGLACGATHESLANMRDNPQAVIEKHEILGCKLTAIGGFFPRGEGEWTQDNWQNFINEYNTIAESMGAAGLRVGYHNHSHEFAHVEPGMTAMDMLVEQLNEHCFFELDMYWIAHGLSAPAEWVDKCAGRVPAVHYKDGAPNPQREHIMLPVGEGNLNWPRINASCKAAGVEWYLVERDSGPHDPFEALEISIRHMRNWDL